MKFLKRGKDRREPVVEPAPGTGAAPDLRGLPHGVGYVNTAHTVMAVNRGLLLANLLLGLVCLALAFALSASREWITVYVPPDTTRGAFQTAGTPSPATVYGFAGLTLQHLNHWPVDGETDYGRAIGAQAAHLSPAFFRQLQADRALLASRSGINELRGRTRALHPAPGRLYSPSRVRRIADGVWGVGIEFRLIETIAASPIKDAVIRYEVRVVRAEVNPDGNRWGLQLDGWIRDPVRVAEEDR